MPELLDESIAEIKEQTAHVADTGEASGSAVADERQAEPVIECDESTAECSDKLEAPVLSDSVCENAMVDESVAVVEEPVAVLNESVAVLEEPVAVLEEPVAAVPDETGTLQDDPAAEHAIRMYIRSSGARRQADRTPGERGTDFRARGADRGGRRPVLSRGGRRSARVANQMTEIDDQAARVDEADAVV